MTGGPGAPEDAPAGSWAYTHGHAEPVLRSHRWRTVDNSAAYLLPHLRDGQAVLDVGCGPATITAEIARRFPGSDVVGIDLSAAVVQGVTDRPANLDLRVADLFDLAPAERTFDVVHAHQVLQHLPDPVGALRHMAALCRPGGLVAVRDADYAAMTWAPAVADLDRWLVDYRAVHQANGGQPDAGRHLLGWAHQAGLIDVTASASVWCFATPADRAWWAGLWADRVTAPESLLGRQLRAQGHEPADLERIAASWRSWAEAPDGWFTVLHGELVARV